MAALLVRNWGKADEVYSPLLAGEKDIDKRSQEFLKIFQQINALPKEQRHEKAAKITPKTIADAIHKGATALAMDEYLRGPLHHIAKLDRADLVRALLVHKAPRDAQDVTGMTALHLSAYLGRQKNIEVLLEYEANANLLAKSTIELGSHENCLPLHFACWFGFVDVVMLLLPKTKNLAATTSKGWNLLHCAAASGSVVIAELLLAAQPSLDPTALTTDQMTCLTIAQQKGHRDFEAFLRQL